MSSVHAEARGREDDEFGAVALHLSGLAGWHLGWSPDRFWRATPAEMEAVVRVMLGSEGPGAGGAPPSREVIARLQEIYPDG